MVVLKSLKQFCERTGGCPLVGATIFFVAIFGIYAGIFGFAQGDPVPDDAYFHFKYAYLLRTEGWNVVENFDWIYLSGNGEGSRYAVNLYQIFLIPFTYFSDHLLGLHFAIAMQIAFVYAIIYYVLRKERIKNPLFFALLLTMSLYFLSRMLLGRAFILILGLIFLEMYFAIHRKFIPLFFVVIAHVLWHQTTYFLPIILIGIVEIIRYFLYRTISFRNICVVAAAVVIGMMFFPGFPGSLFHWMTAIFAMQQQGAAAMSGSLGGAEMVNKDFLTYFVGQEIVFLMLMACFAVVAYVYVTRREDLINGLAKENMLLHWIFVLFVFTLLIIVGSVSISGRFFDFVVPTLCLFVAFAVHIVLDTGGITAHNRFATVAKYFSYLWMGIVCASVLIAVYAKSNTFDYMPAESAATWIKDQSGDSREKVFLHNWGNFTLMFFANSHNVYSTGIEPMTLRSFDESLYWKYYNMLAHNYYCDQKMDCREMVNSIMASLGEKDVSYRDRFMRENGKKIIKSIKDDFHARFVVSDSEEFDKMFYANPELIEAVYVTQSDQYVGKHMKFTVFKLK